MSKEKKRKIQHLYEDSQNTSQSVDRLDNLDRGFNSTDFLKKKNELIIYDGVLRENAPAVILEFDNLDDSDVNVMKIVPILSTTPAFKELDLTFFDFDMYWKKIGNKHYLYIKSEGYVVYDGSSLNVPIYVTLKIFWYNERIYRAVQNLKV